MWSNVEVRRFRGVLTLFVVVATCGAALSGCAPGRSISNTTTTRVPSDPVAVADGANPLVLYPRRAGASASDHEFRVDGDADSYLTLAVVIRTGPLEPRRRHEIPREAIGSSDPARIEASPFAFASVAPFDRKDGVRITLDFDVDGFLDPIVEDATTSTTATNPGSPRPLVELVIQRCTISEVATGRVHRAFTRVLDRSRIVVTFATGATPGPFDLRCEVVQELFPQVLTDFVWRLDV